MSRFEPSGITLMASHPGELRNSHKKAKNCDNKLPNLNLAQGAAILWIRIRRLRLHTLSS
jgi:hypothetical protein